MHQYFFTIHIEGSLKTTTIPNTESYDNEIITFKYYVLPTELFKELQNEIEKEIKIYMAHSDRTLAQRRQPPQLPRKFWRPWVRVWIMVIGRNSQMEQGTYNDLIVIAVTTQAHSYKKDGHVGMYALVLFSFLN